VRLKIECGDLFGFPKTAFGPIIEVEVLTSMFDLQRASIFEWCKVGFESKNGQRRGSC
jgi:hypothetical protein